MENPESARLDAVRQGITEACQRSGRPEAAVTLLAVSKQRTAESILTFHDLGLRQFGENRVSEAVAKQAQLPADIEWHMIGHLQSNKARDCLGFSWLHSLDKIDTARALEKAFAGAARTLNVLLEVNTSGEASKDGVRDFDGLRRLAEAVSQCPHLTLRGLMTMAPFSPHERVVRPCFRQLREWRDSLRAELPHADLETLSMGMTNDYGWAIEEGSTLVRVGTALFEGPR